MATASSHEKPALAFQTGTQLLEWSKKSARYHTGCLRLSQLLGGGFQAGELTEIVGRSGVGKTQLCLTFTRSIISGNDGGRVIFINTSGAFPAYRLAEIVLTRNEDLTEPELENCMKRNILINAFNQVQLMQALDRMDQNVDNIQNGLKAIVVDHINSILSPDVRSEITLGYHQMYTAGRRLKAMAVRYNIPVIVVNHTYEVRNPKPKPDDEELYRVALGKWWSTVANTRIMMTKVDENQDHKITVRLEKSRALATGGTTIVQLAPEGVITPYTPISSQIPNVPSPLPPAVEDFPWMLDRYELERDPTLLVRVIKQKASNPSSFSLDSVSLNIVPDADNDNDESELNKTLSFSP